MRKGTGIGMAGVGAVGVLMLGRARERTRIAEAKRSLIQSSPRPMSGSVEIESLQTLPPPVFRYFRGVLKQGQPLIGSALLSQSGKLRTSVTSHKWFPFTARQLFVPSANGFLWNARVQMPFGTHVRVVDGYSDGHGFSRVSLLSALGVASAAPSPELDSGALHRYLAEAVWVPTALLPQMGVAWQPIDDRAALATISHGHTTVSLEFRFNDMDEVASVFTPGRFGRFDGSYKQVPWEGRFHQYEDRNGMRVPVYGRVGWHLGGELRWVWKGTLVDTRYDGDASEG